MLRATGRARMVKFCSRSGLDTREAMTVGCKLTKQLYFYSKQFTACFGDGLLTGDARLEFLRNSARRLKMRERIERAG